MRPIKYTHQQITALANELTGDSALFADEVQSVIRQLTDLSAVANSFGCEINSNIINLWGSVIPVIAVPNHYKTRWSV